MRGTRCERGQVMPLVAVILVALFGVAAFAIDIGYAYYAKRQLQSTADAAALAGAQDLPNIATAIATATDYVGYNTPANLSGTFTFTYQTKCTAQAIAAVACVATSPNDLTVTGSAVTNTWFSRMFGIDHFNVSTHANACSPCSSTPVDIVVALDRTGSMCLDPSGNTNCSDMNNAKLGVRTMLEALNPAYANVGMVVFPPVKTTAASEVCNAPYDTAGGPSLSFDGYDASTRGYLTDALSSSYLLATGKIDTNSGLGKHTVAGSTPSAGCVEAGGSTSYSEALRQAQAELVRHGRAHVPDFIVFFTDGEANLGSVYPKTSGGQPDPNFPPGGVDDQRPCASGEAAADTIKATGTTIYAIGYALGNKLCTAGEWGPDVYVPATSDVWNFNHTKIVTHGVDAHYDPCVPQASSSCYHEQGNTAESPAITSNEALLDIASPKKFYDKTAPGDVTAIFATIAADIGAGSSRLVDDGF